jgi:putative ABC transport system permease protein
MTRLCLFLIARATPARDREPVLGDTVEEFTRIESAEGVVAARRWLQRETVRVLLHAPAHRAAARPPTFESIPRGDRPMSTIWQDAKYSLRLLGRAPGFTTIAVATLALGIGANTAMFAVVNAVLLKPLPFKDADQLMLVNMLAPDRDAGPGMFREAIWSYPKYRVFEEAQRTFEATALFAGRDYSLAGGTDPERVRGEIVTEAYHAVLGVAPVIGRHFTFDEANRAGGSPVVMISHALWTRRYAADPAIVGRSIQVNDTPHLVVGVLPPGFKGLIGNAELWMPLAVLEPSQLTQRQSHSYTIVARRRAGVSEAEAEAAVHVYGAQVAAHFDEEQEDLRRTARATSLSASRVDADLRRAAIIVLGAVGFVLLIACVNLTNLLVARALARRREVAIRTAIGASRGRIARQFAVESLLLAGFGALGGIAVAAALLAVAQALLPDPDVFFRNSIAPGVPRITGAAGLTRVGAAMIGFDASTLLFTCAVTVLTAALVSLLPALHAASMRPSDVLKAGGSGAGTRGFRGFGARTALVSAQIALALVLLTGAGLMVKSAARLHATGIGVDPHDVLTVRIDLPGATYKPEQGGAFYEQLAERVRALPGVQATGLGNCPPVSGGCNSTIIGFTRGAHRYTGKEPIVGVHWATPDYFSALRIPLKRGRLFNAGDRTGQPKVVLVNESAARAFWPNADPIGKIVTLGQGRFEDGAEVIGVVGDVRYRTIERAAEPEAYLPVAQSYQSRMRLFVRSPLEAQALVGSIVRELKALDPNLPVSEVKTMEERLGDAMWRTRVSAWLLSGFAALALLLTAIGIFGVMSQNVAQRTSEIGVRMALGAQRGNVLRLVLGRAGAVTAAGLVLGIAASLLLARLLTVFLYDVEPTDPATLATVALLLGGVSLGACYLPARRATRIDAVTALRSE